MVTRQAMDADADKQKLIATLQLAYSGERAAGYAYNGHWKSVSDREERERIRKIEDEEWHHRRLVGELLAGLGAGPKAWREVRAAIVGRVLGFLCHVSPWFSPCTERGA